MKKVIFFLSTIALLLFSCNQKMSSSNSSEFQLSKTENRDAAANYKEWCASCHGTQLQDFTNRNWQYGNTKADLIKAIKYGYPDDGMPAYDTTFTDEEVEKLAAYILEESENQKNRYDFKGEKLTSNVFQAMNQTVKLDTVLSDLGSPWGMAFLDNGDFLLTIKSGELYRVNAAGEKQVIDGVPAVVDKGQGGLMDVEIHPNFKQNQYIYLSYSKAAEGDAEGATTAIYRAKLEGNDLKEGKDIFLAKPYVTTRHHYGSRLEFDRQGYLYFSVGDRGKRDDHPQYLSNDCGKIHRIHDDGRIPNDNPFVNQKDAMASIFSYGHRNPQGVAMNPVSGEIWAHEHGPKGGDEVNRIQAGNNYGWPIISYGINYNGTKFTKITDKEGMKQPLLYWVPSIAPCGMDFVTGNRYPAWENQLLVGSLKFNYINLCKVKGNEIVSEELILKNIGRVRSVTMGSDGYIYVGVENPGFVFRLLPVD